MKILKKNGNSIILCAFEILVGVLLLIDPVGFTTGIITVAGVGLLAAGVITVVKYFRTDAAQAAAGQLLARGLAELLAGAFCAFRSQWFVVTFPVLTMIYGVVILITGLGKIQITADLLRGKNGRWFMGAISAAVSIACAVIILRSPFATTAALWVFTGITLIVEAVLDAVTIAIARIKEV